MRTRPIAYSLLLYAVERIHVTLIRKTMFQRRARLIENSESNAVPNEKVDVILMHNVLVSYQTVGAIRN